MLCQQGCGRSRALQGHDNHEVQQSGRHAIRAHLVHAANCNKHLSVPVCAHENPAAEPCSHLLSSSATAACDQGRVKHALC